VVVLQSDEYPQYTGGSSEFNDILTWEVTPASGSPISGSVDVNSRHSAWENGIELNGFDPVCVETFQTLTAPPGVPMTVTVLLTAKNISDSALPSTVMVGVYAPKIVSMNVASAKLGASPNPPPFPGQINHVFRPDQSLDPNKHAVVLYKDAVNTDFTVQDFDVTLTATLAPADMPTDDLVFNWEKVSGPDSGQFLPSDLTAVYRNPKLGGVYRFRLTVRKDGTVLSFGEAVLVLPLAGAEMDSVMQADLAKADAFAAAVTAKYTSRQLQYRKNWRRWFWDQHAGDYTGRPDNADTPTVWAYNQVDDDSGFGAVCTWKGRSVRLTKPSNFILGYAMQQMGTSRAKAQAGTLSLRNILGWNFTDSASVGAGWDVANGANYDTTVSALVNYIWMHEEENDKSRKVWPNPNAPTTIKARPRT